MTFLIFAAALAGAAVALSLDQALLAAAFLLPFALPGGRVAIRFTALCLAVLLFFQHNDILIAILGASQLNKVLAVVAIVSVAMSLRMSDLRATLIAGGLPLVCWLGLFITFGITITIASDRLLAFNATERLLSMGVLSLLFAFGMRSLGDIRLIIGVLLASMIMSASVTTYVYFNGAPVFSPELRGADAIAMWDGQVRSSGTTLESVPMSATLLLGGVMMAFVFAMRAPRYRWWFAAIAALGAAAILLSFTRSATLSLGLAGLFMLWRMRRHPMFARTAAAMAIAGFVALAAAPASVWEKFGALGDASNDSTVLRRNSYQIIGAELLSQNPILGVGAGNYIVHYASDEFRFVPGRSEEPRPLHNVYLQVAAESGFIGAIFFVTMLGATARMLFDLTVSAHQRVRLYGEALLFAFLAMAVQFIFLSSTAVLYFWVIIGLAIALKRIDTDLSKHQFRT
ncbi:MAG: O-antigen ligase family protein [Pseudomonadota bacterium]